MCRAFRKVVAALNKINYAFVLFPSSLPTQTVKEGFYTLSGKENLCLRERLVSLEFLHAGFVSQMMCIYVYLFTKGKLSIFCAYFDLEPMFSRPCWHHI